MFPGSCSHSRSYKLFNASISSDQFIARACDSWFDFISGMCMDRVFDVMGEHADPR